MNTEQLSFMLDGGVVKRFHVIDTIRTQTIAEHSFGVVCILYALTDGDITSRLLVHAILHDVAEHQTGDIPAPAKRRMNIGEQFAAEEHALLRAVGLPTSDELTDYERYLLKLADVADLCLFCIKELSLGNRQMDVVYARGMSYIDELTPHSPNGEALIKYIKERYDEYCK